MRTSTVFPDTHLGPLLADRTAWARRAGTRAFGATQAVTVVRNAG